jgi:hypothetical protein
MDSFLGQHIAEDFLNPLDVTYAVILNIRSVPKPRPVVSSRTTMTNSAYSLSGSLAMRTTPEIGRVPAGPGSVTISAISRS